MTLDSQEKKMQQPTNAQEVGLSSAMHDIRMLAASYEEKRLETCDLETDFALGPVTIDPRLLMVPTPAAHSDRWRAVALALMMLLGLSTSALALTLYHGERQPTSSSSRTYAPVDHHTPAPAEESAQAAPDFILPNEPALYSLPSTRGITATVESHESLAPIPVLRTVVAARPSRVKAPKPEPVSSCDEVACLLDSSDACCQKFESVRAQDESEDVSVVRPYRLTRAQAIEPLQGISGRVRTCFDRHDYRGVASVTLVIAPEGRVQSVALDEGSEQFQTCVKAQVETLQFEALQQPFTLTYPFTYR